MSWIWAIIKAIEPFYWMAFAIAFILALVVPKTPKKRINAAVIICALFSPLPLMYLSSWSSKFSVQEDWAYYQELCRTQAGDKIYKTVDNVEGLFQIKPRNLDPEQPNRKNQYTMEDPFGHAQGDSRDPKGWFLGSGIEEPPLYNFFEMTQGFGKPPSPPYLHYFRVKTGQVVGDTYPYSKNKNAPAYKTEVKSVEQLQSRYGYLTEDLSTVWMRSKWIASGKITIIDLQTKEVLAERTGFIFARHLDGGLDMYAWDRGSLQFCTSGNTNLPSFIKAVLKPINAH